MNQGFQTYQQVGVTTASKEKILIMLYDGAIKFCETAKRKIKENDMAAKGEALVSAQAIIHELIHSLNYKIAPELCQNLENLYMFMSDQLSDANVKIDIKPIDNTISLLKTLRDAWSKAVNNKGKTAAPAAGAKNPVSIQTKFPASASKPMSKPQSQVQELTSRPRLSLRVG